MRRICLRARAKLNLTLDILGILPNGYHEMQMIMQSVDLSDTLMIEKAAQTSLHGVEGPLASPDNLIFRAQRLLEETFSRRLPARFTLDKQIPVAAGLAGGSADCAAALAGLSELYALGLDESALCRLGAQLGADVPFSLVGGTCLAQGDGTQLKRIPNALEGRCLIVMPCEGLSTREIFRAYDAQEPSNRPDTQNALRALRTGDWRLLKQNGGNVLYPPACAYRPQIADAIKTLERCGAVYSAMSGSGPSVFGWFASQMQAQSAAQHFGNAVKWALCNSACEGVTILSREI